MSRLISFVLLTFSIYLSCGCTSLSPHRVSEDSPPDQSGKLPVQPVFSPVASTECFRSGVSCVHIVEYDEFGNVFSRGQLDAAVAAAKSIAGDQGTVIVYVHGWHHSAKLGDKNVSHFLETINQSATRTKKKTVGIYVGWRGDSIDSDNPLTALPSYALTFWNRKATAHSVGNGGGVSELFRKLSAIRSDNEYSQLLIVGHSFGGAIVYSAVSELLAEQISMDSTGDQDSLVSNDNSRWKFDPVADLVVLINPAFEAMRLKPLYSLARSQDYPLGLPPRLVMVTSTADWATRTTFPIGRVLGTVTKGYSNRESRILNRTAIGHYTPYVTHQLVEGKCSNGQIENNLLHLRYDGMHSNNNKELCLEGDDPNQALILTRCDGPSDCDKVTNDHYVVRGPSGQGYIPLRFPIANIRTNENVVQSHGDIWGPKIKLFILGLLEVAIDYPMIAPGVADSAGDLVIPK